MRGIKLQEYKGPADFFIKQCYKISIFTFKEPAKNLKACYNIY